MTLSHQTKIFYDNLDQYLVKEDSAELPYGAYYRLDKDKMILSIGCEKAYINSQILGLRKKGLLDYITVMRNRESDIYIRFLLDN